MEEGFKEVEKDGGVVQGVKKEGLKSDSRK